MIAAHPVTVYETGNTVMVGVQPAMWGDAVDPPRIVLQAPDAAAEPSLRPVRLLVPGRHTTINVAQGSWSMPNAAVLQSTPFADSSPSPARRWASSLLMSLGTCAFAMGLYILVASAGGRLPVRH